MPKEIAVYVGENGKTTDLYQQGKVMIYQRMQGRWSVSREKDFSLGENFTIKGLRDQMSELVDFLGSCKIFVGLSVTGIPYFALEKSRCSIWEFEGNPVEFLDYILAKEEEEEQRQRVVPNPVSPPVPVETFSGCYRISIKEIQEKDLGVTSKQALLPFVRQGKFYSLEVLCNHIPPWLENEILANGLESRTEILGKNEIKLIITKPCCN
ncbi:MAG: nitrogenase [Firmicutes bacterium]|nr:nitrogenase [Bacillota bacterium]